MGAAMTSLDAGVRASRGAALLDKRQPGWAQRVDVERLNLGSDRGCVLGQLFGDYLTGAEGLSGHPWHSPLFTAWATRNGFDAPAATTGRDGGYLTAYRLLTDAWRREVAARQATGVTA